MNKEQLKLAIIQKVILTDDLEMLQAIDKILDLKREAPHDAPPSSLLEGLKLKSDYKEDIDRLNNDIDEVFS
ncbi:MAG: hypothetical protein AAFO07_05920 [Bacteroidota bacterium]